MLQWLATAAIPVVLHANANALSASANMNPPWHDPSPFSIEGPTVIEIRARPGPTSSSTIPIPELALSEAHIAAAHASANAWLIAPSR